jgi:hypothetical protein
MLTRFWAGDGPGEPWSDGGLPHVSDVRTIVCDFNHCVHLAPRSIMGDQVFPEPWQKSAKRKPLITIGRR